MYPWMVYHRDGVHGILVPWYHVINPAMNGLDEAPVNVLKCSKLIIIDISSII